MASAHILERNSMIYAIWPRFRNILNRPPESANITTGFIICYFTYFLICLPFHYIPPHRVRWFFTFKSVIAPIAGFAIVGWVVSSTGNWRQCHILTRKCYSWLCPGIGHDERYLCNGGELRNSQSQHERLREILEKAEFAQCLVDRHSSSLHSHDAVWYHRCQWLEDLVDNWTPKKSGSVFCAAAFLIASIGVNISANSIFVATCLTALPPKYINIHRGQYLAPISRVLIADYWIVHKQVVSVPDMYQPNGIYAYNKHRTNWRAEVAFVVGFAPLLPDFAKSVNAHVGVGEGPTDFYYLGYLYDYNAAQEEINGRKLLDDEASDPRAIDHQARDDGWSLARAATKLASMRSMQAQCRETLASPIM
ncbi:hypothetical protein BDZ45DRAFT_749646 [Acephala macrosclerotiorum]|nr:hypothetical protein BDZ45DRAFT_749646 [Acephala macrosclerotiorum]